MKKLISLFLVVSVLLLSGNMFAQERKGAEGIIQRTDGTQVRSELIAVKENSLLLMERESGADVTEEYFMFKETATIRPTGKNLYNVFDVLRTNLKEKGQ